MYKSLLPTKNESGAIEFLLDNMERQEVYFHHSKRRLGNTTGFALLDQQEKNTSDMEKMRYELSELKDLVKTVQNENRAMQKKSEASQEENAAIRKDVGCPRT